MEDSELTRKAIEELMKEMNEYKEKESIPTERKKNPLGRPNKLFLGRTISSMMMHNKRQSDRSLQGCKRKLKELDAKLRKHKFRKHRKEHHEKSESSYEVISSGSSNDACTSKTIKKQKKKRKKKKQRSSSTSSSTTSCSNQTEYGGSSSKNKNKIYKRTSKVEDYGQEFYDDYVNEVAMRYYVDPNLAYAAMAYNQMNHLMQQQQIVQQQMCNEEESIEIPSDLSISCHSSPESSLNISLNSSSAEEDENGILTFKLSSDEEEKVSKNAQKMNKNSIKMDKIKKPIVDNEEIDKDSVYSHISLESTDSQKPIFRLTNEIYLLSSSDSEELEVVEIVPENISNFSENNGTITNI